MRKLSTLHILAVVIFLPVVSFAQAIPIADGLLVKDWPPEMFYKGKPLPVDCLSSMGDTSHEKSVSLKVCAAHDRKLKKAKVRLDSDDNLSSDDTVGYHATYGDSDGYTYYKFLGRKDSKLIIYVFESGGGTGVFSSVIGVERHGDLLSFSKVYTYGDRCSGGVADAFVDHNTLTYNLLTTPGDLLSTIYAFSGNKRDADYSHDEPACGICCIGTIHKVDEELISVDIQAKHVEHGVAVPPKKDDPEGDESCFENLLATAIAGKKIGYEGGDVTLTKSEILALQPIYEKECLSSK